MFHHLLTTIQMDLIKKKDNLMVGFESATPGFRGYGVI